MQKWNYCYLQGVSFNHAQLYATNPIITFFDKDGKDMHYLGHGYLNLITCEQWIQSEFTLRDRIPNIEFPKEKIDELSGDNKNIKIVEIVLFFLGINGWELTLRDGNCLIFKKPF